MWKQSNFYCFRFQLLKNSICPRVGFHFSFFFFAKVLSHFHITLIVSTASVSTGGSIQIFIASTFNSSKLSCMLPSLLLLPGFFHQSASDSTKIQPLPNPYFNTEIIHKFVK